MNHFEEKKQNRVDRYRENSENAKRRSNEAFESSTKSIAGIPAGQPILSGHHSEKAHRSALEKSHNNMAKSVAESEKADYWEEKAKAAENNNSIYSDDPEAIQKLEARINVLEEEQEKMKLVNKAYRAYKKKPEALEGFDLSEATREVIRNFEPEYAFQKGVFGTWRLKNNKANINRLKKRLESEKSKLGRETKTTRFEEFECNVVENVELNRIQFMFDDIPSEKFRTILKKHRFKFSRYNNNAWQRHLNGNGIYAARCVLEDLKEAV